MKSLLQSIVRLILAVVLLPLLCAAFLLFCISAACSDKHLLPRR